LSNRQKRAAPQRQQQGPEHDRQFRYP
jgi:hypothetical protein